MSSTVIVGVIEKFVDLHSESERHNELKRRATMTTEKLGLFLKIY